MNESERRFIEAVKVELDRSSATLDAATLSRLNRARQRALAQPVPKQRWLMPGLGLATAAVVVLAVALLTAAPKPAPEGVVEHIDLLSTADSIEFYDELEFYLWLESHEQAG